MNNINVPTTGVLTGLDMAESVNAAIASLQENIGGVLTKSVAGGANVTLTTDEFNNGTIKLTGAITANISLIMPASTMAWTIVNGTTGAFTVTVKTSLGTGVVVPQGEIMALYGDGANIYAGSSGVGSVKYSAAQSLLDTEKQQARDNMGLGTAATYPASAFIATTTVNDIGVAGQAGFGVGICPTPPAGVSGVYGYKDTLSDSYGNYQYLDGSQMVWIPAFFYKWGNGTNGLAVNVVSIKPRSAYTTVALANADGYALHRAFYDGGEKEGFFIDKYIGSSNNRIFSSIKYGIPCDTDGSQSGIASLLGVGTNNYGYVQQAAKQRGVLFNGAAFHSASIFMFKALAMLAQAHAQASSSVLNCAWYDATYNFPKGCNNNALGDTNDGSVVFQTAGHPTYSAKPKTGSASIFARTTHNGQNSGVADINGAMWEVAFGMTSDGSNYYVLKTSKRMRDLTGNDATSATSFFGANGIATNYDLVGSTYGGMTASSSQKLMGSVSQVFDPATSGIAWAMTGAGIPIATGTGGTNAFGSDGFWDYRPNEMCPIVGAGWLNAGGAGPWAVALNVVRSTAAADVVGRAALYL